MPRGSRLASAVNVLVPGINNFCAFAVKSFKTTTRIAVYWTIFVVNS